MNQTAVADFSAKQSRASKPLRQFLRRHPALWMAVVLWIGSNLFVQMIAEMGSWEGQAHYTGIADLCRWDCVWYGSVVEHGYNVEPNPDAKANWPFHPAFPISVYPFFRWLKLPLPVAEVVASKLALLLAIYSFLLLLGDTADSHAESLFAGSLVAFNPYIIYAHAGYAEPLYFAVLSLAFYFLAQKKWVASGVAGALASLSRVIGFLFSISYAVAWLRDSHGRPAWRDSKRLVGFLLCPLGTALFMLYLYHHTGDALAQVHVEAAWNKAVGNPLTVLREALGVPHWPRVWAAMTLLSFAASIYLFLLRKTELAIYLALSVTLSVSGGYLSVARYIWWQPPFLCAIYYFLKRYAAWRPLYLAFAAALAAFMILSWFGGNNFVV